MNGGYRWSPAGKKNPAWKGGKITDPEWFRKKYNDEGMTLKQVGVAAGRSMRTAARWAKIHGVKARKPGKVRTGADHPHWKGGRLCQTCGKNKARHRSHGVARRCMPCRAKAYTGSGHPNYKGVADIKVLVREWCKTHWTPEVFRRDGYTCQKCGDSKGGNLQAHHTRRLSVLVDEILLSTEFDMDSPEGRLAAVAFLIGHEEITNLGNGVTLCSSCHKEIHLGKRKDIVRV